MDNDNRGLVYLVRKGGYCFSYRGTLDDAREMASICAGKRDDVLVRYFESRFVTAFDVRNGAVWDHDDVRIPAHHW
jgi:hypothetical protein